MTIRWLSLIVLGVLPVTARAQLLPFDSKMPPKKRPAPEKKTDTPDKSPSGELPNEEHVPPPPSEPPIEALGEAPKEKKVRFELRGFFLSQAVYAYQDAGYGLAGIVPPLPDERIFVEGNFQPSMHVLRNRFGLSLDLSLYLGTIHPKHLVLLNELYADSQVIGPLYILAGRRRIVWGSGLAFNPTDVLNPLKNPLDLSQQRTGAFLLPLVELATRYITASALVSPSITTNSWSLPDSMDFTKPVVGARLYTLAAGLDINTVYYYDFKRQRHWWGLSLSRVFAEILELHAESAMWYGPSGNQALAVIQPAAVACNAYDQQTKVNGSVIGGGRLDFRDQTFLAAEYLYNGDGLNRSDYDRIYDQLGCMRMFSAMSPPPLMQPLGHPVDPPIFLLRQHYVIVSFFRPHLTKELFEAVSIGASLLWGLEDYSVLMTYRVGYRFAGDATVNLVLAGWIAPTDYRSEFSLLGTRFAATAMFRIPY